jgi:DMSO/TMAO reductase YedYZ molybdopterin-dependent catalytic subunit
VAVFSRGFGLRKRESDASLPPGQYLTETFPVLSAGPTQIVGTDDWRFFLETENTRQEWSWADVMALPIEEVATDIHCVTRWSKLGTHWRGVSIDTVFDGVTTQYRYLLAHSYGGYTTNLSLDDLLGGKAWLAFEFDGKPLEPIHGGPMRLLVPHLYFWKSAKWIRGFEMRPENDPGFWEQNGYHIRGDPWKEERYW